MAIGDPFGSLDTTPEASWPGAEEEAQSNLAALQAAQPKPKRSWYDTINDVGHMPGRVLGALTASPASPEADQAAMMPETFVNPLVKNTLDAVGGAIGSGATAPGDAAAGRIPMWDREGHTDPAAIRRAFDTASIAGGGSVAGTAGREAVNPGRDLRVLGKKVGSGEPFPNQLVDQPASVERPFIPMPYQPRGAVDARIDSDLGWHANDAGPTVVSSEVKKPWETGSSTALLSDSAKPGVAIAAAEHASPFYSGLEHAVAQIPQEKMTGSQWLGTLANRPGVKPEELDWTGAKDMLAAKADQPVTKAELQDHLEANKVQLGEVTKAAAPDWHALTPDQQYSVFDRFSELNNGPPRNGAELKDWYDSIAQHSREGHETALDEIISPPRYPSYRLPGGENYREKLLTLGDTPQVKRWKELDAKPLQNDADKAEFIKLSQEIPDEFKGSHWDEPNVLAHLRMNDRTMTEPGYAVQNVKSGHKSQTFATPEEANAYAEGLPDSVYKNARMLNASVPRKSLHLEEIQSDWHQEGRQSGYGGENLKPGWRMVPLETPGEFSLYGPGDAAHPVATGNREHVMGTAQAFGGIAPGVPDAPFKKNWHELALKRALHEAAEGGYDRLSWTPGEAQASNPKVMLGNREPPAGQAERIAKADQGLQGFYNKIVPDYLNKVGKPHGAQVKEGAVPLQVVPTWDNKSWTVSGRNSKTYKTQAEAEVAAQQPVRYMDITPSLRQHLLTKGMPLFEDSAAAAPIAAAAHAGEANVEGAVRSGGRGGAGGVEEAQGTAARLAGAVKPLEGLPQKPIAVGGGAYVPGPNAAIHQVAKDYMASVGRPYERPDRYHPVDPEHAKAIAQAYEEMKHAPDDPKVKASYQAMADETLAQYRALKKSGLKIEAIPPGAPDPYAESPRLAHKDVAENNHLWFFPTEGGFGTDEATGAAKATSAGGEHPLLQKTGEKLGGRELLANDLFRIVHDYFGHLKEGNGFRAAGEDNAWRTHAKMYSDLARPAMTTETRGQNSWLNYGPHGEFNRTASAADTHYAEQKVGLLPDWTMRDKDPAAEVRRAIADPNDATNPTAKYPQYAEAYPPVGPPQLVDKATGKPLNGLKQKAGQKLVDAGKAYWAKQNTPEAQAFQKDRGAIQKDMETKGYEPFFPPEERAHVDPANHPTSLDMTKDALPAKQETIDKYTKMFNTPAARKRLQKAFETGKAIPNADNWYAMRQLEDQYVKHLGPEAGRAAFAKEFAHTMAATTGGADPTSNLLLAHYVQWAAKNGHDIPEASHQLPFPIGGRYVGTNVDQFRKMPQGGFTEDNPKRHDFGHAFLGHPDKATIDEQMSGGIVPGMTIPPGDSYGVAAQIVHDLAKKNGVHPRDFQDMAWAGLKKMKADEAGKTFDYKGPMITDVNDAIERTHRLTGTSRNEIVKRGLVKKEIPLYAGAAAPLGALDSREDR